MKSFDLDPDAVGALVLKRNMDKSFKAITYISPSSRLRLKLLGKPAKETLYR